MGISHIFKICLVTLVLVSKAFAEDTMIQSLSEGACWIESGEMVKLASFNDRESILMSRDEIETQVENLLSGKNNKAITSDLTLHCGGYGASLVIKSEMDGRPICLWVKMNKGNLAIRSLGGLESGKGRVCDGYKWGELIVGIKNPEQKALLESENFRKMIKIVSVINNTTLKVVLDESYFGKEGDVIAELKKQSEFRFIELNLFQHPVGETVAIK